MKLTHKISDSLALPRRSTKTFRNARNQTAFLLTRVLSRPQRFFFPETGIVECKLSDRFPLKGILNRFIGHSHGVHFSSHIVLNLKF